MENSHRFFENRDCKYFPCHKVVQILKNVPKAFESFMAHYGKFSGVTNYIAMIGSKEKDLERSFALLSQSVMAVRMGWHTNLRWKEK